MILNLLAVGVSSGAYKNRLKLTESLILLTIYKAGAGDGNRTHV